MGGGEPAASDVREKLGERRERPSHETPAGSRRMRARGAPICCDAVTLAAHWLLLLAPRAAAAAVALIAVHGGFLFAGNERNHKPCSYKVKSKLWIEKHDSRHATR